MAPSSDISISGDDRKGFCAGELRAGRADVWFDWDHGVQSYLLQNCLDLALRPAVTLPADTQWAFALRKEDEALAANLSRAMVYLSARSNDPQNLKRRHFRSGEGCSLTQQSLAPSRVPLSSVGGMFLMTGIFFFSAAITAVWSRRAQQIRGKISWQRHLASSSVRQGEPIEAHVQMDRAAAPANTDK